MGYTVVHDSVSFRDPDDAKGLSRDQFHWLYANRGEDLPDGVSDRELQKLLDLGAIAETGSDEAEMARRGLPRAGSLRGIANGNGTPLTAGRSENEQVQIMKAALSGVPGPENTESSIQELMKLPGDHLAVMAKALGVEVTEDATKRGLAESIVGRGSETSAEEIAEQRQQRDQRQVAARDFGGEAGLVGENVRSDGTDREGEALDTSETPKASGRGRGKKAADADESGDQS